VSVCHTPVLYQNFNCRSGSEGQYARHQAKFRADPSNRWSDGRFSIFQNGSRPPLGFLKVRNFTYRFATEGQYVSACHISCRSVHLLNRYDRFSTFKDGSRHHLGFVLRVFGPPMKIICWSLSRCKIRLESVQ